MRDGFETLDTLDTLSILKKNFHYPFPSHIPRSFTMPHAYFWGLLPTLE